MRSFLPTALIPTNISFLSGGSPFSPWTLQAAQSRFFFFDSLPSRFHLFPPGGSRAEELGESQS